MAARGLRRKLNQWLHHVDDFDQAMLPHRLECFWNNTYSWARDGHQRMVFPTSRWQSDEVMRRYWVRLQRK